MAKNIKKSSLKYDTSALTELAIGQAVEEMMSNAGNVRRNFERRWYDNNFFDDGAHFRYLSRSQNKIIDLSERSSVYAPMRAIPKTSRQIRGVANLMVSNNFTPIVYPKDVKKEQYPEEGLYEMAVKLSKIIAKRIGHWIESEWEAQELIQKLAFMVLLTLKHGVSFIQIWPDSVDEKIRTQVYDAFDIFLDGSLTEINDCPFIIKATQRLLSEIKADERFDEEKRNQINPDNRHASSEIKEAYMIARYGTDMREKQSATLIQKEAFIKEYLNEENRSRIAKQKNAKDILGVRKEGDMVLRHSFVAGNITLKDEYVDLPEYPFVDYRLEPGPIYQVPMIERFIPLNKTLDVIVSRIERYINTMVTGVWIKRQGEQVSFTNQAGGQIVEYKNTPPVQGQIAAIPGFVFSFLNLIQSLIEEQGVTTSTLGKIPAGVKANAAIESLKESEYATLIIGRERFKNTIKRITEKFMDIGDRYFVKPQEVSILERGDPSYFNIIGQTAANKRKEAGVEIPSNTVPISKDYKVDIEIQAGIAFTEEGKKAAMQQLMQEMRAYAAEGFIPPDAIKIVIEKYLESYQFGATAEFMEVLDDSEELGMLSPNQIESIKVAVAEVIKDMQEAGVFPTSEQRIEEGKVAVASVAKDVKGTPNATQQEQI